MTTKMRVTFLLADPGNLAGGNRVLAQHAAYLRDAGHAVTLVATPRAARRTSGLRGRAKRLLGLEPADGTAESKRNVGDGHFGAAGLTVLRLSRGARPRPEDLPDADVLVASWWETAESAAAMPPGKGVPVHFIQDYEMFGHLPRDRVRAVYEAPLFKIVVAGWLRAKMAEAHGASAHVCANGVDTAIFDAPPRARQPVPTVGFLHSVAPRKTVKLALDALEIARTRIPDLKVRAFGAHKLQAPLPDWVDYVHRPAQADIPGLYAACDLWLFPSRSEGFGLPILEAMACRTPVLATDAGAAPDLIDGLNGQVLPYGPQAFVDGIEAFFARPAQDWPRISAAARATAEANDRAAASARFETLLHEAVATRG